MRFRRLLQINNSFGTNIYLHGKNEGENIIEDGCFEKLQYMTHKSSIKRSRQQFNKETSAQILL
jgi:hypothetical protein